MVGLALAARAGSAVPALERYVQDTAIGVPVVPGELSALANARIAGHLPGLASAAAAWHGTLIADLGNLHAENPAMALARAAAAVVLVVRPSMEGLAHLRESIGALLSRSVTPGGTGARSPWWSSPSPANSGPRSPGPVSCWTRSVQPPRCSVRSPTTRRRRQLCGRSDDQEAAKSALVQSGHA